MSKRKDAVEAKIWRLDRRGFLKATGWATGGLALGVGLWGCKDNGPNGEGAPPPPPPGPPRILPDAMLYINIDNEGTVTLVAHRSEMGQGVRTALPQVLADELDADWDRVRVVQADGDESKWGDQNTDGSYTVRMFYEPMREAGAMARRMLEYSAAAIWAVPVGEVKAEKHQVKHTASDKVLDYGEVVAQTEDWKAVEIDGPQLKAREAFTQIGKGTAIVDLDDMLTGQAGYGMDANIEGMKYAVIARPPVVGSSVDGFNKEAALAVPGVEQVIQMDTAPFPAGFDTPKGGVAVIATNTWAAIKGRDALGVTWTKSDYSNYDTEAYIEELKASAETGGNVYRKEGDTAAAQQASSEVLDTTYITPHLSHTPMEPPCALAKVTGDKCELWAPTQNPQWARGAIAGRLGIKESDVKINVTLLGGGFGRKSKPDFMVEAAILAKETGEPIKVVWTREDDVQHDLYHSISVQRIRVGLKDNAVDSWHQTAAFPPIGGTANKETVHPSVGEVGLGLVDFPYRVPNVTIETGASPAKTRIGWLRSVANIQHGFSLGGMLDEVAHARGLDPKDNLLDMLGDDRSIPFDEMVEGFTNYNTSVNEYPWETGRLKAVIEQVAKDSGWGKKMPAGSGLGICAHRSFLTYVACVVEVKVTGNQITIPNLWYAVDCGTVVNPDRVRSQFEGGANFALSAALRSEITFKNGAAVQSNFHDYQVARMTDAAQKVHVHLMPSEALPTGVGEPPVPPVAPALCNAIFAATGKRIRQLPISLG